MTREWKPGDVARVQLSVDRPTHVAEYQGRGKWQGSWNGFSVETEKLASIRPLVVIDPEDREAVNALLYAQVGATSGCPSVVVVTEAQILNMQAALRSLIEPPKPEEPTGLGAVVEDAEGKWWIRDYELGMRPWRPTESSPVNGRHAPNSLAVDRRGYADINAVRVLSEGVTS